MRLLILFSIVLSYHLCSCQPQDNKSRMKLKKPVKVEHDSLPKDGNCSPEMKQLTMKLVKAANVINDTFYAVNMTMLKRYVVDHDPWELLKKFSLVESDVCFNSTCFKIRDVLEEMATETRIDLKEFLTEEKLKKSELDQEKGEVQTFFKDAHLIHDDWDHIILNVSREVIPYLDQVNYFMKKMQRDVNKPTKKTLQDLSREIPCQLLTLDPATDKRYGQTLDSLVPEYTKKIQNDFIYNKTSKRLLTNLTKFWQQATASKSTLMKSLMEGFTEESYLVLANGLVDALQKVAGSPKLGPELLKVLDAVAENIRTIDFNNLTMVHYEAFMELRTTLMNMNVDVEKLVEAFDNIATVAQERYWEFKTGGWPEMERFVEKLLKSMETDEFWSRVQKQYHYLIRALEKMYTPYEKNLAEWIVTKLRPFEVKAVEYLKKFAGEIGTTKLTIVDDILKFDTTELLRNVSKKVNDTVTQILPLPSKLSKMCYAEEKGIPFFILQWFGLEEHTEKITKIQKALKQILFSENPLSAVHWGWMEIEKLKEKVYKEIITPTNKLITTAVGKCPK